MPLIGTVEEIIHGVTMRDPYRWLEDRSLAETETWIREQQGRCDAYFAECSELDQIERRVRTCLDVEFIDQPARIADRYFYRKRERGREQGSLCVREIRTGEERVVVDPSVDGDYASVGIYRIARDGAYLAYEFGRGGEDRKEIRIVDVNSGVVLPDRIPRGYPRGLAFAPEGYFYSQEKGDSRDIHDIRYHRVGSTGEDKTVLRVPRSPGSRLVLKGDERRLGAIWLRHQGATLIADFLIADYTEISTWSEVFREKRMPYVPILSHGRIFALVETESKSSQLIQLSEDGQELWTIVPEREVPVCQLVITRDRVFVSYLEDGVPIVDSWSLEGQRFPSVALPDGGSIQILAEYGQDTDSFFYSFESFDTPLAIYEYVAGSNASTLWGESDTSKYPKDYRVQEVEVPSKDGAVIPMTLVFGADRAANGPAAMIMTSYGGFGVPMTPKFSVLVTLLVELGAAFALPHIRGGGELGKAWHDAGRARNRQAAFDDFIAAAEWLCERGMTTPHQLAIFGGSNSGLLVGAAMTQRPDLFGAVLCIAPLLDMVRYEVFDEAVKWRREYGTIEDPDDFQALYAYSPYHHIAKQTDYPATMFVSGDRDDRCNPAHVRKMAALIQERPAQTKPVIVDYIEERGHSPVLPLSTRISALARRIAFLCRELKMAVP